MHEPEELLFKYGFTSSKLDPEIRNKTPEERAELLREAEGSRREELLKTVEREKVEVSDGYIAETDYPASAGQLRLVHEAPNISMEEAYFWTLEHIKQDRGFFKVEKVTDIYSASEASAFWGNQQQRISAQQNQAQGMLANVGKFVKELFQMVRELRIIDERLQAYEQWKTSPSADVTLKSIFTDLVEGGTKNPQSVFGLAQTVSFTLLPDLFFNTKVYTVKDLDKKIEAMDYNTSVKNVLRRKLFQFINWKENTHKELTSRRKFNIQYLRQHFEIIRTYMTWAKPYLRNARALSMREDNATNPDIISSFDNSLAEVEFVALKPKKGDHYPVLVVNFQYRTRPEMSVRKEYQQGPSHTGRVEITFRSYAWTQEDIDNYKAMRQQEELALIGMIDSQLGAIMDELYDDLKEYLKERQFEAGIKYQDKKKDTTKPKPPSAFEPFTAVFGGFAEIAGLFIPKPTKKSKSGKKSNKPAQDTALQEMWLVWHIYKKAHRMISW